MSFKRSAHRWFLVACIGGFGLIGLVDIPASAYEGGYYASDSAFVIASRTFSALVAIGSLFFGIRVARMGIFADETGLTVRNVLRTQRALWGEIAGFGPPGAYGSLRRTGLKIVLRDRPAIFATLYSPGALNRPGFADDTLARLEALRTQYGGR